MIYTDVQSAVGNTPLVRLSHFIPDCHFNLFAKLESLNPGGSSKDRPAREIIRAALDKGEIDAQTTVVESSSGNMGVGLAQACAYEGLEFICVVDVKTPAQSVRLMRAYGATVEVIREPDPESGEYLQARLNRVRQLVAEIENSHWPDQTANRANARAHAESTMPEIVEDLGRVDYLFASTGTCGTARGCSEYVQAQKLNTQVIAVDAVGSVIFGHAPGTRLIPGMGAGKVPSLFEPSLISSYELVTDTDCVVGCRRLVSQEGILAGGSAGGVLIAVERLSHTFPVGANCVAIIPDRGERYLDTVYDDDWVHRHLGDISHLWARTSPRSQHRDRETPSIPLAAGNPSS